MGPSPASKYDVNKWYKFSFVMQMLRVLITVMPSSADLKSGDCPFYRTSTPFPTPPPARRYNMGVAPDILLSLA